MSLDVHLYHSQPISKRGTGVFIRRDGQTVELTVAEVKEKWPEAVVEDQEYVTDQVYHGNITHNLNKMAQAAGIYEALWRPDKNGYETAAQIVPVLEAGLAKLKSDPAQYETFNSPNGWGLYQNFVPFVEEYLAKCKQHPDARIEVSR